MGAADTFTIAVYIPAIFKTFFYYVTTLVVLCRIRHLTQQHITDPYTFFKYPIHYSIHPLSCWKNMAQIIPHFQYTSAH